MLGMKVDDSVIPLIPSSGNNRLPGVCESYIKSYKKHIAKATALVILCAFCVCMVYFILQKYVPANKIKRAHPELNYTEYIDMREELANFPSGLPPATTAEAWELQTTICIKTFCRPRCLIRLLKSIRTKYRHVAIVVVDDSVSPLIPSGNNHGLHNLLSIHTAVDVGLSAGRNLAVAYTKTPYCIFMDDDMFIQADTRFDLWFNYLETHSENAISLLGSTLVGRPDYTATYQTTSEEIKVVSRRSKTADSAIITDTERVQNSFMARTDTLREVRWDSILKVGGHTEFFYRYSQQFEVGLHTGVRVYENKLCRAQPFYYGFRRRAVDMYDNYIVAKHNKRRVFGMKLSTNHITFSRVLMDFDNVMNIPYALCCGTALGYYRERSFIKHDHDLDVIVRVEDIKTVHNLKDALSPFFTCIGSFGYSTARGYQTTELTFQHILHNIKFDVFILYTEQIHFDYLLNFIKTKRNSQQITDKVYFKYPKTPTYAVVDWIGRRFRIVSQQWLDIDYGDAWIVPKVEDYRSWSQNDLTGFIWNRQQQNAEDNGPVPILKSDVSFYSQQVLVRGPEEHHRALQDIVDKETPWTLIKTNRHPDLDARLVNKVMAEALAGRRNPGLVCWSGQYTTTAEGKKYRYLPARHIFTLPTVHLRAVTHIHDMSLYAISWWAAREILRTKSMETDVRLVVNKLTHVLEPMRVIYSPFYREKKEISKAKKSVL